MSRESVAVVCPFAGSAREGAEVVERLSQIARRPGDELVLVDNSADGILGSLATTNEATLIRAPREPSSYYARNVGAEATRSSWILFLDSDCIPETDILDAYFAEPVHDKCGAVAGAVAGLGSQSGLLARWARARGVLDQRRLVGKNRPFAATANLLVRRVAWTEVGGFVEGVRSGGDVDFCWRLRDAGWTLEYRDSARVEHVHRVSLRALVRQYARYGAGRSWLERRYRDEPRSSMHVRLLLAAPALILGNVLRGRRELAAFRAIDVAVVIGGLLGRPLDNRSGRAAPGPAETVLLADRFPGGTDFDVVEQLRRNGRHLAVEARTRASGLPAASMRELDVSYLEDDGALRRIRDLCWLMMHRPAAAIEIIRLPGRAEISPAARRTSERRAGLVTAARGGWAEGQALKLAALLRIRYEPLDDRPAPP
jgi:hypothetical protein